MPYLLIMGPEFSLEQRKIMAAELTGALMEALEFSEDRRNWITVQFIAYAPDQIAEGGRLLSETEERSYYCQFLDFDLNMTKKKRLNAAIFPKLMELLGLDGSQTMQIKLLFQECSPQDVVIGGHFLADFEASYQ